MSGKKKATKAYNTLIQWLSNDDTEESGNVVEAIHTVDHYLRQNGVDIERTPNWIVVRYRMPNGDLSRTFYDSYDVAYQEAWTAVSQNKVEAM